MMGINIEKAIARMKQFMYDGVKYSMYGKRDGSDGTADCSGAIYTALRYAGGSNAGWILNTDSLHSWLINNKFQLVGHNVNWNAKRGDVVIFGLKNASAGSAGHVVMFVDNKHFIHCTYKTATRNGVFIDNESYAPYGMGWYVYRLKDGNNNKPANKKPVSNGWIKENGTFKVGTNDPIALRKEPTTKGGLIAYLPKGSVIKYEAFKKDVNGYVWIRQKRGNGYGYMATGQSKNRVRVNYWGSFY